MANNSSLRPKKVMSILGNLTTAQCNSGLVVVADSGGRTCNVIGGWMRAKGGAAAACTSVDVQDTAGTVAIAFGQAGLTQDTVLESAPGTNVTKTNIGGGLAVGKGRLWFGATGRNL